MDPTYTTNMTGLRTSRCGVSFLNESITACQTIARSNSGRAFACVVMRGFTSLHGGRREMLDDGSERQRREERECPDEDDRANQKSHKQGRMRGEGSRTRGNNFLRHKRPRDGQRTHQP